MNSIVSRAARCSAVGLAALLLIALNPLSVFAQAPRVRFERDDDSGRLRVLIDGNEAITYCFASDLDLVHYFPVRSPSGKSMTIQHPDPYPHHRSFWFADRVRPAGGRDVSFYNALYSKVDKDDPKAPFRDRIRHVGFLPSQQGSAREGIVGTKLVWEMDLDQPVLDEVRTMRVVPLADGEYFLDITFTVTAARGEVTFTSDWVHYAWPYLRMSPEFSVQQGGTITNSEGGINQAGTNGKEAVWVDYSNTVGDQTEGLAVFSHPDNAQPHKWLTRDYGCFGPRRIDSRSGETFTLKPGDSLSRRVGVLVHRGDVESGLVAKRYQAYIDGDL
jgi:hypothetical protein